MPARRACRLLLFALSTTSAMCVSHPVAVSAFAPTTPDFGALHTARRSDYPATVPASRAANGGAFEVAQYGVPANACCTPYAPCPLYQPMPIGTPCQCQSASGPIWGYACRL